MDIMNLSDFSLKQLSLDYLLSSVVPAIVIIILGAILINIVVSAEKKVLNHQKVAIDPMLHGLLIKATKGALWIVVLLEVCKKLGIDATSFLTVFAACGAAVALALQGSLSNLAGGILIMFSKPFSKGDYVACAGVEGSVEEIGFLYTTILTVDNKTVSVPNGALTNNVITNATKQETRRVDIQIGISYDSNIDSAKDAVLALADDSGLFLEEPASVCNVLEYADSAVILVFRGWVKTADYWTAFFAMTNGMKPALDSVGIEIPFPQVDVHQK